jgi:hypothetical protein
MRLLLQPPASAHGGVSRTANDAGKHCPVYEPLAATGEDSNILWVPAKSRGAALQAGIQKSPIF